MTTLKLSDLSDLAGPDAAGWSDVAVFVDERGRESPRFVFHGISAVPGWGQAADVRYEHGGGMSEPYLSRPVRRLGRGRLEPSRIAMEGETDLAEQVATLRAACELATRNCEFCGGESSPCTICQHLRAALASTATKGEP